MFTIPIPTGQEHEDRFWAKVNKNGPIPEYKPELGPCWIWTGGLFAKGYGRFKFKRRDTLAHRVAYKYSVGLIPEGTELDHLCRVRACVNPGHLEPVTHRENVLRGKPKEHLTFCKRGLHRLTRKNLYTRTRNGKLERTCRLCANRRNIERYRALKQK